jgi:hypothetical protein
MRFEAKSVGSVHLPEHDRLVLDHARLMGEDFSSRKILQLTVIGSRLEACRFANACINHASFGAGREVSEYIDCVFDGACMDMQPGGYARFVHCSFVNSDLQNWLCSTVELVNCTFTGKLRRAIFNGSVPEDKRALLGRDRNEFHGNDFSKMELIDVGFRTGIDLSRQRLPLGPAYLYLKDAAAVAERVLPIVSGWHDLELRRPGLALLNGIVDDVKGGQRQVLLRQDNYSGYSSLSTEVIVKVFDLLRLVADK